MQKTKGSLLALMAVTMMTSVAAMADSGTGISVPKEREDINGRCRFQGIFSDKGKGGDFAINCRARLRFDKEDLFKPRYDSLNERERDRLQVECDGQEIFDGGLKVIVRKDHDGMGRSRDLNVLFKGKGHDAPVILVNDLEIDRGYGDMSRERDRMRDDNRAILAFERWGFTIQIPGECRFEKEEQNGGGAPVPPL